MLQVVLELEVGAAPRHGRVAAERIVREVQVVVRPLEDRQAELERVVEQRRRGLADAAADRRQDERADDLWPSRKPRSAVRGPTTSLNENISPGWITVPSMKSAIRCTLWMRFDDETPICVVYETSFCADAERAAPSPSSGRAAASPSSTRATWSPCAAAVTRATSCAGSTSRPGRDGTTRTRSPATTNCALCARWIHLPSRGRTIRASDSPSKPTANRCPRGRTRSARASCAGRQRPAPRAVVVDRDRAARAARRAVDAALRAAGVADRGPHARERRVDDGRVARRAAASSAARSSCEPVAARASSTTRRPVRCVTRRRDRLRGPRARSARSTLPAPLARATTGATSTRPARRARPRSRRRARAPRSRARRRETSQPRGTW